MDEQTYQKFREEVAIKSAKRLGAMVGRGWELSPFDQTHLKQIQAGSHDTLTVNSSAIYAEYVAKNKPVVDPEQVEKIKKGLSVDNEEGAIVKEMAKKMAQTNHLDPAEQSLLDYYQSRSLTSGTAAEKISIYNTVLLETSKNLPPQEQPVHLSAPSVTTPEPDMTGKPVEIQPEVHHSLTPSSEPIRENPVVEQNPVVAHVSGSEIPLVEQPIPQPDSAQPQSQGPDWVIYVAPVTDEQPTPSPETSYAENLRFFEGIEASEYELLLPAEYEDIRAYLKNDSYLSNEEITVALYDASLTKDELAHKVDTIGDTKTDDQTKEQITNYLWDIHQTVMDSPFKDLDPTASYQVTAIQQRTIKPEEDPALNQEAKSQKEPKNPQQNEDGILRTALKLKVFEGGMVANMLHNYKTMALLMEKILYRSEQDKLTQTPQNKIMETPVLAPRYTWDQVEKDIKPFGLTKESLQKSGNLDDFLNGRRTGVLSLNQTDAGGTVTPLSGKLYIAEVPNQGPRVFIQAQKEEIRLPNSYLGHTLTPEDKKNLL